MERVVAENIARGFPAPVVVSRGTFKCTYKAKSSYYSTIRTGILNMGDTITFTTQSNVNK